MAKPIPLLAGTRIDRICLGLGWYHRDGCAWRMNPEDEIILAPGGRIIIDLDREGELLVSRETLPDPLDPEEVFCNEEIGA